MAQRSCKLMLLVCGGKALLFVRFFEHHLEKYVVHFKLGDVVVILEDFGVVDH